MKKIEKLGSVTVDIKVMITSRRDIVFLNPDNTRKGLYLGHECNDETLALLRDYFEKETQEARDIASGTLKEQL